ncbi:BadF/BadG/BcrA/BcrD ATPase family protein [Terriglobus sp. 2YAB30_2]|uniref:BadF/BadG/BcrA/BcrD ATPase family protein n=1 Tax=unclassified Terriglobus TaxID=2628988 RepID=UPI003F9D3890
MAFYLGMDAGGSRTRVAVSEDGRELARVEGESIKTLRIAEGDADARRAAEARFGALIEELGSKAGVDLRYVERSSVGLSGASVPAVREFVDRVLSRRVGGTVEIVGDQVIALDAAFSGGDGILVIAGTGSNVGGRFGDTLFGAGGWGPMLGDEGSGYWIGHEALRSATKARDRGENPLVLTEAMRAWNVEGIGDLIAVAHRPGTSFAGLSQVVVACADRGDAVAIDVLRRAGEELATQVVTVHRKMQAAGFAASECGVAYTGSVLGKIDRVRESFNAAILQQIPGARFVEGEVDAVVGALWRAAHRR